MVEYPWGWRIPTHSFSGVAQNVQCFTVKWFDCAFGKGRNVRLGELLNPPRWFIFSYFPVFLFGLMEQRFGGEIWLRDRLIWLPASRSITRSIFLIAKWCNFISKIEYLKSSDNITVLDRVHFLKHINNT